jgi:hypothetical protein
LAATYAVPGAWCEGSIVETRVKSPKAFGVMLVQVNPASRVTCSRPSSEPTHMSPATSGDSTAAKIVA